VQTGNTATNLTAGNYTATITDANGCISTSPVTITLTNNISMSSRLDTSLCFGASFSPNLSSNASSFSWSPTTGVSNPALLNPVLNPTLTTTYTVSGVLGSCTISRTFTVNVLQAITVNAGNDVTILTGSSVQLQGAGPAGTYLWTPSTALSSTGILNPVASPIATTTYTLRITTAAGCTNTDDMTVIVVPYCVKPMNAFTPNGDGFNDKWLVTDGPCVTNVTALVYNRYGARVFESTDYKNTWDGTYKGKPLPDATYYYKLVFTLISGKVIHASGDVTLLR
jgi:gliding motility-associated-like protein